jgi:hypothetical protein
MKRKSITLGLADPHSRLAYVTPVTQNFKLRWCKSDAKGTGHSTALSLRRLEDLHRISRLAVTYLTQGRGRAKGELE